MSRAKTSPPGENAVAGSIYRQLWESSLDACSLLHCERDAAGRFVDFVFDHVNPAAATAVGLAGQAMVGRRLCEVVPIHRGGALHQRYLAVAQTGVTLDEECELNLAEIDARWVRQQVIATGDGIAIIARDISARKEEESRNRRNRVFLKTLIDLLPVLIAVKSVRPRDFGEVLVWNKAAERITGYTADGAGDPAVRGLVPPDVDAFVSAVDGRVEGEPSPTEAAFPFVKRDGTLRELRTIAVPLLDRYGKPEFALGIAEDTTELAAAREQLVRHANHDALTGLPNRRLFLDRLTHALERRARSKRGLSLLFVDLDHFKAVNDALGHTVGDELLKEVGVRLSRSARAVDTVCRLSGDEFIIVMEETGPRSLDEAGIIARRVIDALNKPFLLGAHAIRVTASIGISICPGDGTDADTLIRCADRALYRAKALGKNTYQHCSEPVAGDPADGGARVAAGDVAAARATRA